MNAPALTKPPCTQPEQITVSISSLRVMLEALRELSDACGLSVGQTRVKLEIKTALERHGRAS
jgi:hypothetical protein